MQLILFDTVLSQIHAESLCVLITKKPHGVWGFLFVLSEEVMVLEQQNQFSYSELLRCSCTACPSNRRRTEPL